MHFYILVIDNKTEIKNNAFTKVSEVGNAEMNLTKDIQITYTKHYRHCSLKLRPKETAWYQQMGQKTPTCKDVSLPHIIRKFQDELTKISEKDFVELTRWFWHTCKFKGPKVVKTFEKEPKLEV